MTDDLSWFKAGLKSKSVIVVTDSVGAWHISDPHLSALAPASFVGSNPMDLDDASCESYADSVVATTDK